MSACTSTRSYREPRRSGSSISVSAADAQRDLDRQDMMEARTDLVRASVRSRGDILFHLDAKVAELVDAQDLGSCGATRPGSSPGFRIWLSDDDLEWGLSNRGPPFRSDCGSTMTTLSRKHCDHGASKLACFFRSDAAFGSRISTCRSWFSREWSLARLIVAPLAHGRCLRRSAIPRSAAAPIGGTSPPRIDSPNLRIDVDSRQGAALAQLFPDSRPPWIRPEAEKAFDSHLFS